MDGKYSHRRALAGTLPSYHPSQVRAIGQAVLELPLDQGHSVRELLVLLEAMMMRDGIDALHPCWCGAKPNPPLSPTLTPTPTPNLTLAPTRRVGNLAMPRPLEVSAALNRLRSLQIAASKRRDFEKL